MIPLYLLTDYKGFFGSKWDAYPYRSGMNLSELRREFEGLGFNAIFLSFAEAANKNCINSGDIVVYTSSEDMGFKYKSFIEDVILYLSEKRSKVIPSFLILRATNNKVLMELLRKGLAISNDEYINTKVYGTLEESISTKRDFPVVIKTAAGAMSKGVRLADSERDFVSIAGWASRTKNFMFEIKDKLRRLKHHGYKNESKNRDKFIVQKLIPGLKNDYKILVFGERYFIFSRPVRKNDFRASGSGFSNYKFGSKCIYPQGIFDFAREIFSKLNVPQLSIDIAYDGKNFYLIEFQGVLFGSVGFVKSDVFYSMCDGKWQMFPKTISLEKAYAESIAWFIEKDK